MDIGYVILALLAGTPNLPGVDPRILRGGVFRAGILRGGGLGTCGLGKGG